MNDREAHDRIVQAIGSSKYQWRTPRGIAKDSGLPLQEVLDVLKRSDVFVRARKGNAEGEPLYTTKERYKSEASLLQRALSALTNRITA